VKCRRIEEDKLKVQQQHQVQTVAETDEP